MMLSKAAFDGLLVKKWCIQQNWWKNVNSTKYGCKKFVKSTDFVYIRAGLEAGFTFFYIYLNPLLDLKASLKIMFDFLCKYCTLVQT